MSPPELSDEAQRRIARLLDDLYGRGTGRRLLARVTDLIAGYRQEAGPPPPTAGPFTEKDLFLITYPDMLTDPGRPPLAVLHRFLQDHLAGVVSGLHLLPFFPSSSDDGFSVIDYRSVAPDLGDWGHIEAIATDFRLMADAVINHVSTKSEWFQAFLRGGEPYTDYFVTVDPDADLSTVVRPRDLPLLTPFHTAEGEQLVWTTFSADQVDLSYRNPQVLLEILAVLLDYLKHGVQVFRLDAVAYLWKEVGTPSIHLPQTHLLIQLLRAVLEAAAPWSRLITETNVPHRENLSYFGNGRNEAHLVYQFPLPPLILHAFVAGDARALTTWAEGLEPPADGTSFFNFLASHDGIGLRPAIDLLAPADLERLQATAENRGGGTTYRRTQGGGRQPYELNISLLNALSPPAELEAHPDRSVRRFLCAHAILLSLQGLPALYFHSLVGSQNDLQGVHQSGRLRSINRQKLPLQSLQRELASAETLRAAIFQGLIRLIRTRRSHPAFHPASSQRVLRLDRSLFAVTRYAHDGSERVAAIHEVSGRPQQVALAELPGEQWFDLLADEPIDRDRIELAPWGVCWLGSRRPAEAR